MINEKKKFTEFAQDLNLDPKIISNLKKLNYTEPTPIQEQTIPLILQKKDVLGCAQTGTGKTGAFSLPIIQNLLNQKQDLILEKFKPVVLILAPTRELALQIEESIQDYSQGTGLKSTSIFGGVGQGNQVKALQAGVHILVATPGRLMDLIQQKYLFLNRVKTFVLDEADRMLDMGFISDIKKILPLLPAQRHNLFFSATMPKEVAQLAQSYLKNPVSVSVTPPQSTAEKITQWVLYVDKPRKRDLLLFLLQKPEYYRVIVFARTKHGADRISEVMQKNRITSAAIHGDKKQGARQRALEGFKSGEIQVLIATDIMARGIDVDGVTHVINYDVPHQAESYVHRIGRTARAGTEGIAISFCDTEEKSFIAEIEKEIKQKIPLSKDHPYHSKAVELSEVISAGKAKALMEAKNKMGQKKSSSRGFRSKGGASKAQGASAGGSKNASPFDKRSEKKSFFKKRFSSKQK